MFSEEFEEQVVLEEEKEDLVEEPPQISSDQIEEPPKQEQIPEIVPQVPPEDNLETNQTNE